MRPWGVVLAAAVVTFIACGGSGTTPTDSTPTGNAPLTNLPACGTSTALFSVSPVSFADLLGWVPLGNLNPPGHLFPTDHQYLYINNPDGNVAHPQVNVVSPGAITITRAHRTHYSVSDTYDYDLEFSPCAEVFAEFGHVTTIVQSLLDQMGAFDQECGSYSLGTGAVFTNCYTKPIAVAVAAGAPVGTTGGQGTSFALDFGLHDSRVTPLVYANPSHWHSNENGHDQFHTTAASDYFAEPARTQIRAHLGSYNGSAIRTVEPLGGTIAYDIAGTAQGLWFNPAQPGNPEGPHLAVALDNVDPSRVVFSIGTSQPSFPAGAYSITPVSAGLVNRRPSQVTADGNIYCYEFEASQGALLVQLVNATSLKLEGRAGTTTCAAQQPFSFGANAFTYQR